MSISDCPETILYFAYDIDRSAEWLVEQGISVYRSAEATVPHHRLEFNALEDPDFYLEQRGRANLVIAPREHAEGVIHELDEHALPLLDALNGVESLLRYRKQVPVLSDNGTKSLAYVYVAWPEHTSNGLRPSHSYKGRLMNASTVRSSDQFKEWLEDHPTTR